MRIPLLAKKTSFIAPKRLAHCHAVSSYGKWLFHNAVHFPRGTICSLFSKEVNNDPMLSHRGMVRREGGWVGVGEGQPYKISGLLCPSKLLHGKHIDMSGIIVTLLIPDQLNPKFHEC